MRGHLYTCGCYVLRGADGDVLRDVICSRHAPIGRALNVMRTLSGRREMWNALELQPSADVRELAHTDYHSLERAIGELDATLALEREGSGRPRPLATAPDGSVWPTPEPTATAGGRS